ncbi:MAG: N-acetylmuramoyl-L-alanine amidase [Verrucomicrobiales bacterium]|nr:N-acetylmuramoyl-L-alanine amidase [Verrucomicrobiales bacterium]
MLHSNHFSTFKVLVFLCLSLLAFTPNNTAKAVPFTKVILDAGHGGHDFGGTFGLTYEKHLALDVVRRVEIYLKSQGISTKLTRSRDTFISLPRRARIANAESGAIFVSIHFNHARSRKAAGIETFYHTKNKNSLKLAHMIQSAALYKTRANNRGVKKGNFLVLSKNNRPAVLLECAFLTNSSDRYRALDPEYRQRMAEAVAMGIIKFRQSN